MRRSVSVPRILVLVIALVAPAAALHADDSGVPATGAPAAATPGDAPQAGARGAAPNLTAAEPMGPVENLTAYPVPPEGFNVARENIPHGEVKLVEYDSKTLGIRRPLRVYTPPGYSTGRRYPVL